ncbi:MAG: hypothetical protein IJ087_19595 [Eggerthellaceae bacterium]|nr:hypothetical protein [Eggerthellaceae bacterium]
MPTVQKKLDFGDYMTRDSNISIDTKRNIDELAQNVGRDHSRFKREMKRAADAGCRLIVLVENSDGYTNMGDLCRWTATHCRKCKYFKSGACMPMQNEKKCIKHGTVKPLQGARLYKTLNTMCNRYGAHVEFVSPENAAKVICERLGVDYVAGDA